MPQLRIQPSVAFYDHSVTCNSKMKLLFQLQLINEVVIFQQPYGHESSAATYCRELLECLNRAEESTVIKIREHISDTMLCFLPPSFARESLL